MSCVLAAKTVVCWWLCTASTTQRCSEHHQHGMQHEGVGMPAWANPSARPAATLACPVRSDPHDSSAQHVAAAVTPTATSSTTAVRDAGLTGPRWPPGGGMRADAPQVLSQPSSSARARLATPVPLPQLHKPASGNGLPRVLATVAGDGLKPVQTPEPREEISDISSAGLASGALPCPALPSGHHTADYELHPAFSCHCRPIMARSA